MTPPPYTFVFDWRPTEHARVTRLLLSDQLRGPGWRVLKWGLASLLLIGAAVSVSTALAGDLTSTLQLVPLVVIVAVLAFRFAHITAWLQARRVAKSDPNVRYPIRQTLDATGLTVEMRTIRAELKWDGMHQVRETEDLFLFYYSAHLAYYLPKRVIGPQGAAAELSRWIRDQVSPAIRFLAADGAPEEEA